MVSTAGPGFKLMTSWTRVFSFTTRPRRLAQNNRVFLFFEIFNHPTRRRLRGLHRRHWRTDKWRPTARATPSEAFRRCPKRLDRFAPSLNFCQIPHPPFWERLQTCDKFSKVRQLGSGARESKKMQVSKFSLNWQFNSEKETLKWFKFFSLFDCRSSPCNRFYESSLRVLKEF